MKRTKRWGLLRNAAVALGNWGSPEAVPALAQALGRIPDERSVDALRTRLLVEEDEWVVSEIKPSLDED